MTEPTTPAHRQEILIVEDSAVEAELLRRSLARAGYAVTVAADGEKGLQAARAHRPGLVVSDINMPVMDGYELCRAIKHDDELWNVPVFLLTMLSQAPDIIEALDAGADGYAIKPFIESSMLERIRVLLATPILRKRSEERRSVKAEYGNKPFTITGSGEQILNLLLSVYQSTIQQSHDLLRTQSQLNLLNENLDKQVRERTAALAESEKRFRAIFDNALDGILLADAQTRQFFIGNSAICLMLGYSHEEIMQLGVADIHPQQALPHVVEQFEKQLRGEIQLAADIPVKRKDGSVFYADIKSSPVNLDGKNYLIGIFYDTTERKQAESKLNEQLIELQRWREATMGREMRVLELKHEVNELLGQAGQPPRYSSAEASAE